MSPVCKYPIQESNLSSHGNYKMSIKPPQITDISCEISAQSHVYIVAHNKTNCPERMYRCITVICVYINTHAGVFGHLSNMETHRF